MSGHTINPGMTEEKPTLRPAERLEGITINGRWVVKQKIARETTATGGTFSIGYIVESVADGRSGFLKAIDYADALGADDPAEALRDLTNAFLFERDVCDRCTRKAFDRIVVSWAHGAIRLDPKDRFSTVQYLVFELATSDIRAHLDKLEKIDLAWQLRAIHHMAVGIQQLHSVDVAHQDLKPSNVLVFGERGSKIADLGRAACKVLGSVYDNHVVAGDRAYAPPELLYGYTPAEWGTRRFGCDLYLLGSMIVFMFSRMTMTGLVLTHLGNEFKPGNWRGSFKDVLPYVRDAFDRSLLRIEKDFPESVRAEMLTVVRQLCEPDPVLRGHPEARVGKQDPLSLERYISQFNLLATQVEAGLIRSKS